MGRMVANVHGASSPSYVSYYPIHGTFHAVCTPTSNSSAQGTVTLDISF